MKNKIKSKKRLYLFIPLMAVLVLMNVAAFAVAVIGKNVWLFIACFFLLVLTLVGIYMIASLSKSINKFYQTMEKQLSPYTNKSLRDFPLPVLVTRRRGGEIIWYNNQMREKVFGGSDCFGHSLAEYFPAVNLQTECPVQGYGVEYNGHQYTAYHAPTGEEDNRLNVLYLVDDDKLKRIAREYFSSRPVAAIILIDNYEELVKNTTDSEKSNILAGIDKRLFAWVKDSSAVLRKYDRDKYIFVIENAELDKLVARKFSVLQEVREIENHEGVVATLSIGIGRDGETLAESYQFAGLAVDMALSRGGDQAVIKNKFNFAFFGGLSEEVEKRTKVKSRVVANALSQLIRDSSQVLVMGHKNSDMDAIGAAAGMVCAARVKGRPVHIVVDRQHTMANDLIERLETQSEYKGVFISAEDAMIACDFNTLLIVVDVNRPGYVESAALLESINKIAVIDHHRRAADYIENAVVSLHEPYASSASELVSELLQYLVPTSGILTCEAEAMLAGIYLDTKGFATRTGVRTFEAAAYLRRAGAESSESSVCSSPALTSIWSARS